MKFLRIVGLGFALAAVAPAKAATVTLVSSPATWKWRKGTNEASNPISAWRAIDYEDSQFTTAPAPFCRTQNMASVATGSLGLSSANL